MGITIARTQEISVLLNRHTLQRLNERLFHDNKFEEFGVKLNGIGKGVLTKKEDETDTYYLTLYSLPPNFIFIIRKSGYGANKERNNTYIASTVEWVFRPVSSGREVNAHFMSEGSAE